MWSRGGRSLRSQVIHGDVTLDNALVDDRGRISGIIDFGRHEPLGARVRPVRRARVCCCKGGEPNDVVPLAMRCIDGYRSVTPLEPEELAVLPDLLADAARDRRGVVRMARASSPRQRVSARVGGTPVAVARVPRQRAGGNCWGARLRAGEPVADAPALIERRRSVFGPALSPLTYDRPLHLVRGEGVWLVDADGDRFLDCYNNVPVVGHCHPRVTDAIARQSRLLNTNMRYLHDAAIELAERLLATHARRTRGSTRCCS